MEASNTPTRRITYQDLSSFHFPNFEDKPDAANVRSAMNRFLKAHGKTWEEEIGAELTSGFSGAVMLALEGLGENSLDGVRSRILAWQKSYLELAKTDGLPKEFHSALKMAREMAGLSQKVLGRSVGVGGGNISNWESGRNIPATGKQHIVERIAAIERELELPPNTLLSRLADTTERIVPKTTAYGEKIRILKQMPYRLNEWPENLEGEFKELVSFKTRDIIRGKLKRNKKWRTDNHNQVPSANAFREHLNAFFGFCCLPSDAEDKRMCGKGFQAENLSLALLSDVDLVHDYLKFQKVRSDGYNGGTMTFFNKILATLHPETGFLTQYSKYARRLPQPVGPEDWREHCAAAHGEIREMQKQVEALVTKGRDPNIHLRPILDEQNPLDVLLEMNRLAEENFRRKWSGRKITETTALKYRNILLSNMLVTHPLRAKNYSRMTFREDGTGHLRKRPDGSWWLEIPKEEFKNEQGAAGEREYKVKVDPDLWPMIETYLEIYRPMLVKPETAFLFLNSKQSEAQRKIPQEPTLAGCMKVATIYDNFKQFAARYCPVTIAGWVGPHSVRHIVATDYLKNHPDGVAVAAAVLHDRPETVSREYAHLLTYDHYAHFQRYLTDRRNNIDEEDE